MYTLTTNNKHQCYDSIHAAVSILNTYIANDLNGLDTYTLCTVHEHDSVVASHERTNYTRDIACTIQHIT